MPRVARAIRDHLDLRWLIVGSMLPDIIDKPLMFAFPDSVVGSGRTVAHSLLFIVALGIASLIANRGAMTARAALLALAVASLGHLALDGMWQMPQTLLWPLRGWGFPHIDVGPMVPHVMRVLTTKPQTYVPEAVGFAISLAFGLRLLLRHTAGSFLMTGKV